MQSTTVQVVEQRRLAYYRRQADHSMWDAHWATLDPELRKESYHRFDQGALDYFERPFIAHLPTNGRILEAGCGLAYYVAALRSRGFAAEGVDFANKTIERVRSVRPDLPVRFGDVTALHDVPDNTYDGYISLGVVEHRKEGPEPFLCEALRILRPGGVALISVPHFNVLRRAKAFLGRYRHESETTDFYQYAFTKREFAGVLKRSGFCWNHVYEYGVFKGVKDESRLVRWMLTVPKVRGVIWRCLHRLEEIRLAKAFAHMILFVCSKPETVVTVKDNAASY